MQSVKNATNTCGSINFKLYMLPYYVSLAYRVTY